MFGQDDSMSKFSGIVYAMLSSATFGLIPLFTLPVIAGGMHTRSIIFYRMLFSVAMLGLMLLARRQSLKISAKQLRTVFVLSLFYAATSMLLVESYLYIPSGLATTISFLYPIAVTLILFFVFKQRLSAVTVTATLLSVLGVALLSLTFSEGSFQTVGLVCVIVTIFTYSTYIVGINKSCASSLGSLQLSFYVLLFTTLFFGINMLVKGGLEPIVRVSDLGSLLLLGFIPTVLSNVFLMLALKRTDSATVSLFGCMEPLTALLVGCFVFGEQIGAVQILGVGIIILAVLMVVFKTRSDG